MDERRIRDAAVAIWDPEGILKFLAGRTCVVGLGAGMRRKKPVPYGERVIPAPLVIKLYGMSKDIPKQLTLKL